MTDQISASQQVEVCCQALQSAGTVHVADEIFGFCFAATDNGDSVPVLQRSRDEMAPNETRPAYDNQVHQRLLTC